MCVCVLGSFSHIQLCVTLWTVSHQAPLSMGFSRQEYGGIAIPVLLPGKSHGQTSLVGYSPWGRKELDTTKVT